LSIATSETTLEPKINQSAKEKILNSALLLFADKGFEGASTREIAEAAGVNHALIKYYFGNKEQLWQAAVNLLFERLNQALAAFGEASKAVSRPAERFRILVEHYVRYCAEYPQHARIMSQESNNANPRLTWAVRKHVADSRALLDNLFQELFDANLLPRMSLISLRYMFTAACQNVFALAAEVELLYGVDATHEAQIKEHTQAVLALFLRENSNTLE
jgi:TetR/AcrR family transcriptional regulator